MQSYKDLVVWQKGIQLVSDVYRLTEKFPKQEMFGLTSQMRRSAVSIPANIAEGYCRKHGPEYIQFLRIAFGSGAELETHFVIAEKLSFSTSTEMRSAKELLDEIMRMLNKIISTLVMKT